MAHSARTKTTLAAALAAIGFAGTALAGPPPDRIIQCALSSCEIRIWDGPYGYVQYWDKQNNVQVSSCPCAYDVPGPLGTLQEQKFAPAEIAPGLSTSGGGSTPVDGTYVDSGIVFGPVDEEAVEAERKERTRFRTVPRRGERKAPPIERTVPAAVRR